MLNMSFEEALDGKHPAFFCCLLSRGKHQLAVLAVFDTLTFGVPVLLWNLYKNTNKTLKLMIPIIPIVGFITYLLASLH